jgi:dienelactone hydrolase
VIAFYRDRFSVDPVARCLTDDCLNLKAWHERSDLVRYAGRRRLTAYLVGMLLVYRTSAAQEPTNVDAPAVTATERRVDVSERLVTVPLIEGHGRTAQLHARVCYRNGDVPATLVLINHGSPPNAADRPKMSLGRCDQEAAQWFLGHGYVVAFVLRRGYGENGGKWAEDYGGCSSPNFVRAGLETAVDIDAAVRALITLPFVKSSGVIIVGQSAGGWGAIAYNSVPHPQVAAFVVMAGGRGGHHDNRPRENCRPDLLAESAGHFGRTAATPMLWIYTANDSYLACLLQRRWQGRIRAACRLW